jgi:hypothetical protein
MPGTTADIWAIVAVATVSLAAMLILVVWHAPRAQERQAAAGRQVRVGSRRDESVTGAVTVPSPRSPGAEDSEQGDKAREQVTHGSPGSPMDL